MQISGCIAVVSGAAGGIGNALVKQLAEQGASCIYCADLPHKLAKVSFWPEEAVLLELDVTNSKSVSKLAKQCGGVNILVNNAAILEFSGLIQTPSLEGARAQFEVNFWGYLAMCRAFAPILSKNGGGAIINILSEAAWVNAPFVGAYSASKAAAWSMTQGIRAELRQQNTHVLAVFPSSTDTEMLADLDGEKENPAEVAKAIICGLQHDNEELSVGSHAKYFEQLTRSDPKAAEAEFAQFLPGTATIPDIEK